MFGLMNRREWFVYLVASIASLFGWSTPVKKKPMVVHTFGTPLNKPGPVCSFGSLWNKPGTEQPFAWKPVVSKRATTDSLFYEG